MNRRGIQLQNLYWNMMSRCYRPTHKSFHRYGGRGITVCAAWRRSKDTFIAWALANGWRAGLEIDRINNDRGYLPGNCRFVTRKVNRATSTVTQAVIDSARLRGADPVIRQKLSESITKSWQAPSRRIKQTKAMKAAWQRPEYKVQAATAMRRRWADPEWRARVSALIKNSKSKHV